MAISIGATVIKQVQHRFQGEKELLKEGDEKESDLEAKYLENAKFFAHLEVHWT